MASTPSHLLIVCPHCCHAMVADGGRLHCSTCHTVWVPPAWLDHADPIERPSTHVHAA
jgi:hypothetical protein